MEVSQLASEKGYKVKVTITAVNITVIPSMVPPQSFLLLHRAF